MSLKWFDAAFIGLCVVLAVFVAAWALQNDRWPLAFVAIAGGAVLVIYRRAFLHKTEGFERR